MRPTQKTWCDTCKQMTYGCKHPENDATKEPVKEETKISRRQRQGCTWQQAEKQTHARWKDLIGYGKFAQEPEPEPTTLTAVVRHGEPEPELVPMRTTFVCFEEKEIGGGAMATVTAVPQVVFKPERLVVDPNYAPFFRLTGIRVGHCCQERHPWVRGVGCRIFEPHREDLTPLNNLEGTDVVQAGMLFSLLVTNITPRAHAFNAIVWGKTPR